MKENIRQALARIRAQAYNEGHIAGRAEGYAAAMKELEDVLGSVPRTSAEPKRTRNAKASADILAYLAENPGAKLYEIKAACSCSESAIRKAVRRGELQQIGARFLLAKPPVKANSTSLEEQPDVAAN